MKNIVLILLITLTSCASINKEKSNLQDEDSISKKLKSLVLLSKTKENEKIITSFKNVKLIEEKNKLNENRTYLIENKNIFIDKEGRCRFLKEVFDDTFIIFSKSKNTSELRPSGIDTFQRSELFIYDTIFKKMFYLDFSEPILLVFSNDILSANFNKKTEIEFNSMKIKRYSINDIEISQKRISLFGQHHKKVNFKLEELKDLPFICNSKNIKK